jgi:predicted Zn-dependent peptidase
LQNTASVQTRQPTPAPAAGPSEQISDRFLLHTLPNGMVLLGERMAGVSSAAMTLLLPAGVANDPADSIGAATVLAELTLRGAGTRPSKELTDHLDRLGLQRSSSVGVNHTRYGSAALAPRVLEGLGTYADIIRRPMLPADQVHQAKELALQALAGIDDDPRTKVLLKLREVHWPEPFGRNAMGVAEHVESIDHAKVKSEHAARFRPQGTILAVAGAIEFRSLVDRVESLFGGWQGASRPLAVGSRPSQQIVYEQADSEQTHIGIAWPSVPETHPDYYAARLASEVLSGGMSGRLFTEVREKRALCYSVGASYASYPGAASLLGYAGTQPERAQATLDQFLHEVHRMAEGVTQAELERARIGLKASTIMSGESSGSRAGSIAHDYFTRGRIRTLDEIKRDIDAVTLDRVNAYLKLNRPGPFTVVVVGPKELRVASGQ